MKKTKKITAVLLILLMAVAAVACSSGNAGKSSVYNNGVLSLTVPEGWTIIEMKDSNQNVVKTNLSIAKAADASKAMSSPMITISYGGPDKDLLPVSKDFYEGAEDVASWEIGGKKFEGFKAQSVGENMIYYFAVDKDKEYQVVLWPNMGGGNISIEDADVQQIVKSLTGK